MPDRDELAAFASELADAARKVILPYWRKSLAVEEKDEPDRAIAVSPVTEADRNTERALRDLIESRYPEHGIFGEEFDAVREDAEWVWVLDPIDGTKSFITGKPLFGVLVALLYRGRPVLGLIDQPVLRERWLGRMGQRTTLNGEELRARDCSELSEAYMYATTPHMFEGWTAPAFDALRQQVRVPLYGCDCYAYGLLAAGHCDLVVEATMMPYDYCALVPVIEGAGGVITDWQGGPLTWHGPQEAGSEGTQGRRQPQEVLAAGGSQVHAACLETLRRYADAELGTED